MTPAEQLTFYMKSIYEKRLTTTSGGNLSIRDAEGNIWITPASVDVSGDLQSLLGGGAFDSPLNMDL